MSDSLDISDWLKYAGNDIRLAKAAMFLQPPVLEGVCYHCQQAIEKSIKTVLIIERNLMLIQKSHSISRLLDALDSEKHPFPEIFYNYAEQLSIYATDGKYPNKKYEPTIDFASKGIEWAEKVYKWCSDIVNEYQPLYKQIYPDFDDMPELPLQWSDTSNTEDGMPSFSASLSEEVYCKLLINYKNKELQRIKTDKRFTLLCNDKHVLSHNSLDKITYQIKQLEYIQ